MLLDGAPVLLARPEMALLDPRALPEVLGEVVTPGVRVATLLNRRCRTHHRPLARTPLTHRQHPALSLRRSGLQLGSAGDGADGATIAAISSKVWQSHDKGEDAGVPRS